jgi:hypothetical protein
MLNNSWRNIKKGDDVRCELIPNKPVIGRVLETDHDDRNQLPRCLVAFENEKTAWIVCYELEVV